MANKVFGLHKVCHTDDMPNLPVGTVIAFCGYNVTPTPERVKLVPPQESYECVRPLIWRGLSGYSKDKEYNCKGFGKVNFLIIKWPKPAVLSPAKLAAASRALQKFVKDHQ